VGGVDDLYLALEEFFEVCKTAIASTDAGLQECHYLAAGPPAWDVSCLIAYAGGPAVGDTFPLQPALAPMHRIQLERQVNLVPLTAISLRCQPEVDDHGILPTPQEQAATAKAVLQDVWALWNHLRAAKSSATLFAPKEREFSLEPGIAYNPQGAVVGAAITVRTQLDGYTPT
jgi:hypothetical protein